MSLVVARLRRIASALVACLAFAHGDHAYSAYVEIAWGVGGDRVWNSSSNPNSLAAMSNATYFSTLSGYNGQNFYNADFASSSLCAALVPTTATVTSTRKYGCRALDYGGNNIFVGTPVADTGPVARAQGILNISPTSLSGTLTILASTDEPTGATTTFLSSGVRVSNSVGNGTNGYNYRSAEYTPFGNQWSGVTTAGTLEINLTGIFLGPQWEITGGTARFTDAGYACQQGGLSGSFDVLCTRSSVAGGFDRNGSHLSWGWDLDGGATGTTMSEMQVRNQAGDAVLAALGGVRAQTAFSYSRPYDPQTGYAAVDVRGMTGEFRRGTGSSTCATSLHWDGSSLSCGTLVVGRVGLCLSSVSADPIGPEPIPGCDAVALASAPVPVPPSVALLASALGILGATRFRNKARTVQGSDPIK